MTLYHDDGQKRLGRSAVGIDLNAEYLDMAKRRCAQMAMIV